MQDILPNIGSAFSAGQLVQLIHCAESMSIAFLLSLILRLHFIRFGNVISNRREIANSLPFIVLIVTLVITIINSSLTLSLGLIGALSIVRFRTPIKETEELAYLFMAIATGIGIGAGQIVVTVFSFLIIMGTLAIFGKWKGDAKSNAVHISVRWPVADTAFNFETLSNSLKPLSKTINIQRMESASGSTHVLFHLDMPKHDEVYAFVEKTSHEHPKTEIIVIDQSITGT